MVAGIAVEERIVPSWIRALEILVGLIAIVVGFYVLVNQAVAVLTLVVFLSWALIVIGIRQIVMGVMARWRPAAVRGLGIMAGLLALALGFVVLVYPGLAIATLVWLLTLGLFVFGVSEISVGVGARLLRGWQRGLFVVIGVIDLILAPILLLMPSLAVLTLVILLSLVLVVNGISSVASGASGRFRVAAPGAARARGGGAGR